MTRPLLAPRPIGPTIHLAPLDDWHSLAACRTADPDLFNGPGLDVPTALAICAQCTVRAECGEFGRRERAEGVYGGQLLVNGRVPKWTHHDAEQRREHVLTLAADGRNVADIALIFGVTCPTIRRDFATLGLRTVRVYSRRAEHGTRSRYTAGCHCQPCRDAENAYGRTRTRPRRTKSRAPQREKAAS